MMTKNKETDPGVDWMPWIAPHDPRRLDNVILMEDEHGRLVASADCGLRCPGCGICCEGYHDQITVDYFGVEEFDGNLKLGRGGLIRLNDEQWYRIPHCGGSCPGYGRCCPPIGQRDRPRTVADARRVLLGDQASRLWEMHEALLILAHEGTAEAVQVLEAYMPRAHTRVAGFAECALDEGRFFASIPRNPEEAQIMMKQEVRTEWDERAIDAYGEIEELQHKLERQQYELEIARRLLEKAEGESARQTWQTQVDVLGMIVQTTERHIEEQQEEMDLCDAMVAEIDIDLGDDASESGYDLTGGDLPF
jgi:hypothetical protein